MSFGHVIKSLIYKCVRRTASSNCYMHRSVALDTAFATVNIKKNIKSRLYDTEERTNEQQRKKTDANEWTNASNEKNQNSR